MLNPIEICHCDFSYVDSWFWCENGIKKPLQSEEERIRHQESWICGQQPNWRHFASLQHKRGYFDTKNFAANGNANLYIYENATIVRYNVLSL